MRFIPYGSEIGFERRRVAEIATIEAELPKIAVSETLSHVPHKVVARWIRDRRASILRYRRTGDENVPEHERGEFGELDQRRLRFADALFKALARQHIDTDYDGYGIVSYVCGQEVRYDIEELCKNRRITLEPGELHPTLLSPGKYYFEWHRTGNLRLSIRAALPAPLRSLFDDTDTMLIEARIKTIVATIMAAGPALAAKKELEVQAERERQQKERQRQIDEHNAYEEKRRRKREHNRWRKLIEFARLQEDVELGRAFLARLKEGDHSNDAQAGEMTVQEWFEWAEQRATKMDVLAKGAASIFDSIGDVTEYTYKD
ncbi:MAG: hypothetical protein WBA44_00095 [Mesorhizobium sp.]